MNFRTKLERLRQDGELPENLANILHEFFTTYRHSLMRAGKDTAPAERLFDLHMDFVVQALKTPHQFEPYHEAIRSPFDYREYALEWVEHILDSDESMLLGAYNAKKIAEQVARGENVILLSNHQTEPDPQVLSLMLAPEHPELADSIIFVAGDRVTTDPISIPYSLGHNLICIYSKRHIENPPEKKTEKQDHNRKTMKRMAELLQEGGKCIWVAPSGGRDRPNEKGEIEIAPFNPQSIEMFLLMARQSGQPTHFYPLSLWTYYLLPPPDSVEVELGETRRASLTPAHLCFGDEIDFGELEFSEYKDRRERRELRAGAVCQRVKDGYARIVAQVGFPRTA